MAETLLLNQPFVTANLTSGTDTLNYTIPSGQGGLYAVHVELTEVPPTGLSVIVKQNASTVYTAPTISPTQIAQQFKYSQIFAAADVVSVVLSSSTAIDKVANNVKATVTIQQGQ
jgi:hypothetical protein